ncbi:MAG TPA: glycosyltransferase family 4 protein [Vicinamibacterales bacterium]|nr:glycosyltransferase family 4 protein [Vicinamibacterales bacterium]
MLAAITLHPRGGGVATVSRLLKDVLEETWRSELRVVTLLGEDAPPAGRLPLSSQLSFGARVAIGAASRDCPWILFAHPSLARVQAFIPPAWRKPYAVFLHGVEAWHPLTDAQRLVLERATLLVANSRFTAERVAAAHPTLPPIAACPLALPRDTHRLAPGSTLAVPDRSVLVVARMSASERYKGHDELLDAWPAVRSRVPDARLVFVGDGDDVPRLKAKAQSLVPGAVTFGGFVGDADLARWYQGAAVLAMPSRGEGFGLAYLEAMRHGVPCLGSRHDAAREVIDDGVTGYLVDQGNSTEIADCLVALLTDDARRRAMGEAGRRRAEQEFSRDRFATRLRSLLTDAFGAHEAAGLAGVPGAVR